MFNESESDRKMPRKGSTQYGEKRVQIPKKLKKQIKRLYEQGIKPRKIKEMLNLGNMPRSTFNLCVKYNETDETKSKIRNKTVDKIQAEFERDVTILYRQRARSRGFGRQFLAVCCREIYSQQLIRSKLEKFTVEVIKP